MLNNSTEIPEPENTSLTQFWMTIFRVLTYFTNELFNQIRVFEVLIGCQMYLSGDIYCDISKTILLDVKW